MAGEMKKCRFCGKEMPENAQYCLACAAPQSTRPVPLPRQMKSRRGTIVALTAPIALLSLGAGIFFLSRRAVSDPAKEPVENEIAAALSEENTAEIPDLTLDLPETAPESETKTAPLDPAGETDPPRVTDKAEIPAVTSKAETPPTTAKAETPPATTAKAETPAEEPETKKSDALDSDGTLHHGDYSVRILNDLKSETSNYFAYMGDGKFQTFRVISAEVYSSGETLRLRGNATAVTPAETDNKIELWFFYVGQNQTASAPLLKKTVTVIKSGVNEGLTVSFDLPAALWSELSATGHSDFLLFLADI